MALIKKFFKKIIIYGKNHFIGVKEIFENLKNYYFSGKAKKDIVYYSIQEKNLKKCFEYFPKFKKYFLLRNQENLENLNNILNKIDKTKKVFNSFNLDKKLLKNVISEKSKIHISGYMRNVNISQFVELKKKISYSKFLSKKRLSYNVDDLQIFKRDKHTQLLINNIRRKKNLKNLKRKSFSNKTNFFNNISFKIIKNINKNSLIFKENSRLKNKHIFEAVSKSKNIFQKYNKKNILRKKNKKKLNSLHSIKKSFFFITKDG